MALKHKTVPGEIITINGIRIIISGYTTLSILDYVDDLKFEKPTHKALEEEFGSTLPAFITSGKDF